jgi:type I restriction enzyme M protein
MLWFLRQSTGRAGPESTVLFVDARQIATEVSRSLNTWTPEQVEFLANIARLHQGKTPEPHGGSEELMAQHFPGGDYADVAGLCKAATILAIEAQGWSLNPGRYVGSTSTSASELGFSERIRSLDKELANLFEEGAALQGRVTASIRATLRSRGQ